jgi:hypothetical protein
MGIYKVYDEKKEWMKVSFADNARVLAENVSVISR